MNMIDLNEILMFAVMRSWLAEKLSVDKKIH